MGGCEDLIDEGCNGYFIPRDVEAIKALIVELEADRPLVRRLGEANRRTVLERYSWSVKVKDWLGFIESHLRLPLATPSLPSLAAHASPLHGV